MEEEGKQEDKFEFTPEGEVFGYISSDQAEVLAMRTARETPGAYGAAYENVPMAFEVVESEETEDHYRITLAFRPEGAFDGAPGREQFVIEKEGNLAVRQVLSLPQRGGRRFPTVPIAIGLVVVVAAVVGGVFAVVGGGSGESTPVAAVLPTGTPERPAPTTTPTATIVSAVVAAATSTPTPTPTTIAPLVVPTPTPLPAATPTRTPTPTPKPKQPRLLHWWPGDGDANDIVGGNNGAMRAGATFAPGKVGQAFSLTQEGAHVEILSGNDDLNFSLRQPMTLTMWVKRTLPLVQSQQMTLIGKRAQGCGSSHYDMPYNGNSISFIPGLGNSGSVGVFETDILPVDEWRHVGIAFDGEMFRMYIDGRLKGRPNSGIFSSPNNDALNIGGSGGCNTFGGLIDEVAFFNNALSADDL